MALHLVLGVFAAGPSLLPLLSPLSLVKLFLSEASLAFLHLLLDGPLSHELLKRHLLEPPLLLLVDHVEFRERSRVTEHVLLFLLRDGEVRGGGLRSLFNGQLLLHFLLKRLLHLLFVIDLIHKHLV